MIGNICEYKGYFAKLNFDLEDAIIVGEVINTNEIISFHAEELSQVMHSFKDAIDTYLEICEEEKIAPAKPYSGKFNLRVDPELHRQLCIDAARQDLSMNDLIIKFIQKGLSHYHA